MVAFVWCVEGTTLMISDLYEKRTVENRYYSLRELTTGIDFAIFKPEIGGPWCDET